MSRTIDALKRVNATARVEHDPVLRAAVLAAVLLAFILTAVSGLLGWGEVAVVTLLTSAASLWAWRRRADVTHGTKVVVALGALFSLYRFFTEAALSGSIDDVREPLTRLFVFVQLLHAADTPSRRDVVFGLVSSVVVVALSATGEPGPAFVVLAVAYLAAAVLALARAQESAAREEVEQLAAEERWSAARCRAVGAREPLTHGAARHLRGLVPVLAAGAVVFVLVPTTASQTRLAGLPFSGGGGLPVGTGAVENPGLPFEGDPGDRTERGPFDPSAYFGFAQSVDIRTSGTLSDEPVLKVRTDRPRLLRGIVFDTYDGAGWTRPEDEPEPISGIPAAIPGLQPTDARPERLVQTIELLDDTPNLIFAAAEPRQVWLAGGSVLPWDDGTITTPVIMDEGTVYSVVSADDRTPRRVLRGAVTPTGTDPDDVARWTALPEDLPQRVRDLAASLTAGEASPYAKAEAVEDWLGANVEYTLDAPPAPLGGDAVDQFLFETRRGWCEPIASSMVVLLRAAGVPARFATGFMPGSRGVISGQWTVLQSDAHAWVEVAVPGHGWVAFDPTGAVPLATDPQAEVQRIPLALALGWVRDRLPEGRALVLTLALGAAVAGLLAGSTIAGRRLLRERRERRLPAWDRLVARLGRGGVTGAPWQTPREYVEAVRRARPDLPVDDLERLRAAEEDRRYRPDPPVRDDAEDEDGALGRVLELLDR